MVCALARHISKKSTPQIPYTLATQRERDPESSLMHYRARSYDPRLGRFIQKDPQDRVIEHYRYAGNNPVRATDPTGLTALNVINATIRESFFTVDALKKWGLPEDYILNLHLKGIDLYRHHDLVLRLMHLKWESTGHVEFFIMVFRNYSLEEIKNASVSFQAYEYLNSPPRIGFETVLRLYPGAATFAFGYPVAKPIMEATTAGATAANEAADWLMTAVDAIENGPSWWHLVGILPGISGTTMRKIGDAIDVARKMGKPIWSSTKKLDSVENAFTHWKNHGPEFPQFRNSKEYVEGANKFVTNPPSGTLTKTRSNGDKLFYNPSSNTFAVQSADGVPRTMFKPQDGIEYWNKQ